MGGDPSRRDQVMRDLRRSNHKYEANAGDVVEIIAANARAWSGLRNKVGRDQEPDQPITAKRSTDPHCYPIHNTQSEGRLTKGNRFTVRDVATRMSG